MRLFFAQITDFFLPRLCCHCFQKLLVRQKFVCDRCHAEIKQIPAELLELEYNRKFRNYGIIDDFFSLYIFTSGLPLQSVLHSLKYDHNIKTGIEFGKQAAQFFKNELSQLSIDFIVPIPLHPLKKAERGYNQSYFIAKGISAVLNKPILSGTIKRVRNTPSQTKLDMSERRDNINGAFLCKKNKKISGKNLLIVDDVITTGATVSECGKVLKKTGAKKIFALSIGLAE